MSKNVVIQEGGEGKQFTADKLKTNLVGGGTCLWVPEDETALGTKYITKDGTYKASNDGYYGYSKVTVSGIGSVTGKDGDGDEATATVDPETGEIVIEKIPSRISVIEPPTNPYGIYQDGQTISKDGMVVKAYFESGLEYGIVPNGEITLSPTTAVYDESTDVPGGTVTEEGDMGELFPSYAAAVNFPIETSSAVRDYSIYWEDVISGEFIFMTSVTSYGATLWACSYQPSTCTIAQRDPPSPSQPDPAWDTHEIPIDIKATFNGKEFYVNKVYESNNQPNYQIDGPKVVTGNITFIAYCILFGQTVPIQAGSRQTINVSWPRPGDGKILETTFEIRVAPGYTPGGQGED